MVGLSHAVRAHRYERMTAFMRREGFDALAFTGADWVEWGLNQHVLERAWERPFLLVVTADGHSAAFLSEVSRPSVMAATERGCLWADEVHFYADTPAAARFSRWNASTYGEMVGDGLAALGLRGARIGVDALTAPLARLSRRGVQAVPAGHDLKALRWVKHPDELATLRAAAALSDWAMQTARDEIRPGRLGIEIDCALNLRITAEAVRRMPDAAFTTTSVFCLSGPFAAGIHGDNAPVDRRIQDRSVAIVQISSRLNGLFMELTRPWFVGQVSPQLQAYVDCVRDAQEAGIAVARPGAPVSGIQAAAQAVVEKAGFAEFFRLRAGHGIGVMMHDFPEDLPLADRPLEEGEAYAVEPGLYIPNVGGFRFADIIAITASGAERITKSSKDPEQLRLSGTAQAKEPVSI